MRSLYVAPAQSMFTVTITSIPTPERWAGKWWAGARQGSTTVVLGLLPMLASAGQVLGWRSRGLTMAVTVKPKVGRWRPGWPWPKLCNAAGLHTPHCNRILWSLEIRICVFPNSSKFQSKFTPA